MNRFLLVLFFLNSVCFSLNAAVVKSTPVANDSSDIVLRKFNPAELQQYRENSDFYYEETGIEVGMSLWDKFWNRFWGLFRSAFGAAADSNLFQYVVIAVGSAAIIYALVRLYGLDFSLLFTGKSKVIELAIEEKTEDIHQISFEQEIQSAIHRNDYRLAVRLLYLRTLKVLDDAGHIRWQADKTNSEYISELENLAQQASFRTLTHQFEYVWYGGFEIEKDAFSKIDQGFGRFNRRQYV